jgi:hypothetical protein
MTMSVKHVPKIKQTINRATTREDIGCMPIKIKASICSVTFIEEISAAMADLLARQARYRG